MEEKAASNAITPARAEAEKPPQWLWQVPLFIAGVIALAIVGITKLPWRSWQPSGMDRDLSEARKLLDQQPVDLDQIIHLTASGLDQELTHPVLAGQAHFLLGSAYLRQVAKDLKPADSQALLEARQHLEKAEQLGVPESDRLSLAYRLGKVYFRLDENPKLVIEKLTGSVEEAAEDPAEGYSMIVQSYLRLPEKEIDLEAALAANSKLLELPEQNDGVLAPARLQRGDLLLRLGKPEAARSTLEKVGASATPEVLAQARYLLASSHQQEKHWAKAMQLWQEALADKRHKPIDADRVFYNLGICQKQLEQFTAAEKSWEQCVTGDPGSEIAQAANLLLGDLRLTKLSHHDKDDSRRALEAFSKALQDVTDPNHWTNTLITLARCRSLVDSGCHILRETGQYELSIELTRMYERVALPGRAAELQGEALHFWAMNLSEEAAKESKPELRRSILNRARSLYRKAGDAFGKAAELGSTPESSTSSLWQSAANYIEGKESAKAAGILQTYVEKASNPQQRGEGFYRMGEAQRTLNNLDLARDAFQKCLKYPGPFGYRARFQLAQMDIDRGKWDDAKDVLEQNLQLLSADNDREAHEKTIFALGHLNLDREDFQAALFRLEEAVEKYPKSSQALVSRYEIGECYKRLGEESFKKFKESLKEVSADSYRQQGRDNYTKALAKFQEVMHLLLDRQKTDKLSEEEQTVLTLASFGEAGCYRGLENVKKARELYRRLAVENQYSNRGLQALSALLYCYYEDEHNVFEALRILDEMERAITSMPDSAFAAETDAGSRKAWAAWIADTRSKIKK